MQIPFTKAHGACNDFLLTWAADAPAGDRAAMARAICDRHTGVGADGWILLTPADAASDGAIELYNSDGSTAELSGNGTRCAAAFLIRHGLPAEVVRIRTGAGLKRLRLLKRDGLAFEFEMEMGVPEITAGRFLLPLSTGARDVTLVWVGNPQCAVPVEDFDFDWRAMGAEIESHGHFPKRTNVSFVKRAGEHSIEVRFYERGAGETMSSGTGSTGAVAAAMARGWAISPVEVRTPAGPLLACIQDSVVWLTGPADIVAAGLYLL
ncbi:MAG: diaminopimelate epimerase [Bryobacteraceae bacterium]